jgi:hypothetical protein
VRTARAIALGLVVLALASRARADEPLPLRDLSEEFDVLLVQQPIVIDVVEPLPLPSLTSATRFAALVAPRHHRAKAKPAPRTITRIVNVRTEAFPPIRIAVIKPHIVLSAPVIRELPVFTARQETGFAFLLLSLAGFYMTTLLRTAPQPAYLQARRRFNLTPKRDPEFGVRRATGSQ